MTGRLGTLLALPRRALRLFARGDQYLQDAASSARQGAKRAGQTLDESRRVHASLANLQAELRKTRDEVHELRRELRDRLLQYHHQLGRLSSAVGSRPSSSPPRLSGRTVPVRLGAEPAAPWLRIGGEDAPVDPNGDQWLHLERCPVCAGAERKLVCPWNKFILATRAPDAASARYDFSVCQACGVLYAARRPVGERYRFLLAHFGEVTVKRGGAAQIPNRVLNPYPLSDDDRAELRRRAAAGVFVSDHLRLTRKQYLPPLLRDRFENSVHVDLLGALLEPRGARVLEVRSRAGTVLDGLRRAWGAEVFAMPIWESQQLLLRELFKIPTSDLIDFERFKVPFPGPFDLVTCNHMFTHVLYPRDFFAELARVLSPGGHVYLYNEPDDAEFLAGKQSMLATLNPLHMQAFDQASLLRALAANGFDVVFATRRGLQHLVLARRDPEVRMTPIGPEERERRVSEYEAAFAGAVLRMPPQARARAGNEWSEMVERAVAAGVAEYDAGGNLRLVAPVSRRRR